MTNKQGSHSNRINLDDAPAYLIQRTARLLRWHFMRTFIGAHSGVTPEQWMLLNRLREYGKLSQVDLTDRAFRDRPNITRMLEKLEQRGLVEREPDPEDGRRQLVTLTDQGERFLEAAAPLALEERQVVYAGLSSDDIELLRRVLAQIEQNILDSAERD
ncbi:MAG: MarR family transcriptional regulator [Chloroflexi bacterium]|nr:MarR family transcriptional regulator [Chloroflexota bacterium]